MGENMRTIWKHKLKVTDSQFVYLPQGAQILSVQVQQSSPVIWATVDSDQPAEKRFIATIGTGNPISEPSDSLTYIGTYQIPPLVFHVFEVTQ